TYLYLLGATPLPQLAPVVASVSPAAGSPAGGTTITISPPKGMTFTQDCVVDFGVVPAAKFNVAADGTSITATSPAGLGTVDVRVTNCYGTSAVAPALTTPTYDDRFSFNQFASAK